MKLAVQTARFCVILILLFAANSSFGQTNGDSPCCLNCQARQQSLTAPTPRRFPELTRSRFPATRHPASRESTYSGRNQIVPVTWESPTQPKRAVSVTWHIDLEKATKTARLEGRPLLVRFTADWCGYCRKMSSEVFADPGVQSDLARGFVLVELDADENRELVRRIGIQSLPTTLILTSDMQIATRMEGYRDVLQLRQELSKFVPRAEVIRNTELAQVDSDHTRISMMP